MEPILTYDFSTEPFPLQAGFKKAAAAASLTMVATNTSGQPATLKGIIVRIPIGNDAAQLTNDAKSITPAYPNDWDLLSPQFPEGSIQFTFVPRGKETIDIEDREAVDFVFNNIHVNEQPGTVEIQVKEAALSTPVTTTLYCTKFPNAWGVVKFDGTQTDIPYAGGIRLSWEGPPRATYVLQYYSNEKKIVVQIPQPGQPPLSNSGVYPAKDQPQLALTKTTTFTLTVTEVVNGKTYNARDQVTVTVGDAPPPQITSLSASPNPVDFGKGPMKVAITWATVNAVKLELEGVDIATQNVTGQTNAAVRPNRTTLYALTATGVDNVQVRKVIRVQSFTDFLEYNVFTLKDEDWGKTQNSDGGSSWQFNLEEKLEFYADHTGVYNWRITGHTAINRKIFPRDDKGSHSTRWSMEGSRITINTPIGTIVVVLTGSLALQYQTSLKSVFTKRNVTLFNPSPSARKIKDYDAELTDTE